MNTLRAKAVNKNLYSSISELLVEVRVCSHARYNKQPLILDTYCSTRGV